MKNKSKKFFPSEQLLFSKPNTGSTRPAWTSPSNHGFIPLLILERTSESLSTQPARQLIHQSGLCKTDLLALSVLNSPLKGL